MKVINTNLTERVFDCKNFVCRFDVTLIKSVKVDKYTYVFRTLARSYIILRNLGL